MNAKKRTCFAALVMSSLSGTANAMLPLTMLLMAPMMGIGHMNLYGQGDMSQGATADGGHDHADGAMSNHHDGDTTGGRYQQKVLPGTFGPAGAAKE